MEKVVGNRWIEVISKTLEASNYGIVCLTPENLNRPWIHFEAGAISKVVGSSFVCPYVYSVEIPLPDGPLSQFHAVRANRSGTWELVQALNKLREPPLVGLDLLEAGFNKFWEDLNMSISDMPPPSATQTSERSDREILEEILKSIRGTNARSYLNELRKPPKDRGIELFELTTALHTVIRWILQNLNLKYTVGSSVDYEIEIHEQIVLIETKIGDLQDPLYLNATLNQVKNALNEKKKALDQSRSNASAIVVIPDYPQVSDEPNKKQNLDGILFCPITQLKEHLSGILEQDAAEVPLPSDIRT